MLLKTYQRLGYFVTSDQVANMIIEHIAASLAEPCDRGNLCKYDGSQARRKHLSAVRQFLEVKPFDEQGKTLMREAFADAARSKEDAIDIINIGIETLVRHRYELPAFDTLVGGLLQTRHFICKFMMHLEKPTENLLAICSLGLVIFLDSAAL